MANGDFKRRCGWKAATRSLGVEGESLAGIERVRLGCIGQRKEGVPVVFRSDTICEIDTFITLWPNPEAAPRELHR